MLSSWSTTLLARPALLTAFASLSKFDAGQQLLCVELLPQVQTPTLEGTSCHVLRRLVV